MSILKKSFFNHDACTVARNLLGKIIRRNYQGNWLTARIIETEAYYLNDKGSHASLGFTNKRKALFMPAGTIYMYYARGKDSLNVSTQGEGCAVLIKSAIAFSDKLTHSDAIQIMQSLNPLASGKKRSEEKLCSGQTLLCQSLALKVNDWDQQQFDKQCFYFDDTGIKVSKAIQTTRLGIPKGRDEHLHYRYIDYEFTKYATSNPLTKRGWKENKEFTFILK